MRDHAAHILAMGARAAVVVLVAPFLVTLGAVLIVHQLLDED